MGDIKATRRDWEEAWHGAPVVEGDGALVSVVLERLPKVREESDYFRFLALAQRAVAVCWYTFRHEATSLASEDPSATLAALRAQGAAVAAMTREPDPAPSPSSN